MPFFYRSHDAGSGAFYYRSNEVRATQTVVGVDIITDVRSAFFNTDVLAVDGDSVTLPTVFQGSTITLFANGLYEISPALPAGTQIPRDFFKAATSTTYSDFLIVFDDIGEVVTVSAASDMTATGGGSETALGLVSITSIADLQATGTGTESASRDATITAVSALDVSGTASGVDGGEVIIASVASMQATGTAAGDPQISGEATISGVAQIIISGFVSGGQIDAGDVSISVMAQCFIDGFISAQNNNPFPTNRIFSFH